MHDLFPSAIAESLYFVIMNFALCVHRSVPTLLQDLTVHELHTWQNGGVHWICCEIC